MTTDCYSPPSAPGQGGSSIGFTFACPTRDFAPRRGRSSKASSISPVRWERDSRLTDGIASETPFYFVHSFAPSPSPDDLLGSAAYGARFACAAERDNVFGVQFHPEKSSAAGLRLLSNFAGVCAATPAPA